MREEHFLQAQQAARERIKKKNTKHADKPLDNAMRYGVAVARWMAAGCPTRHKKDVDYIHDHICKPCSQYLHGKCKLCGCKVNTKQSPLINKIAMATENCPIGKWDAPGTKLMDIVYPLASGSHGKKKLGSMWGDNELRYSLRSLERYFPNLGRVFIVTEKLPDWLTNVVHIPAKDLHTRNKDANLIDKVLLACKSGVSETFLRLSDDQCLLRDWNGADVFHMDNVDGVEGDKWWKRCQNTCDYLKSHGKPTLFYDCHCPIPVDRDAFIRIAEAAPYNEPPGMCINTLYCNFAEIPRVRMTHEKAAFHKPVGLETIQRQSEGRLFLGYNDDGLNDAMKEFLAMRFPTPSRFEKEATQSMRTQEKIAVVLLTCDRYDYTVQTVESLLRHHPPGTLNLFHGDDASTDSRVVEYVQSKGFLTVMQNATRLGCSPSTDNLLHIVAAYVEPGTAVLYLQNDLECVRPLPVSQIHDLLNRADISFVQLSYRKPGTRYAKNIPWHYENGEPWPFGATKHDVVYAGYGRGMGFQPSISKIETWLPAVKGDKCEKEFRGQSEYPDRQMCRLTLPVFRHIGRLRTPNGEFGKRRAGTRSRTGLARYDTTAQNNNDLITKRTNRQMGASVNKALCEILSPGMKTLECGSGLSTYLFLALGCNHTALENNKQFAPPLECVQICPLVGDPPWYEWTPEGRYDFILVDGPWRSVGRYGIMRVIESIVHERTLLLFDDTHRKRDRRLCLRVAKMLNSTAIVIHPTNEQDYGKEATLLIPEGYELPLSLHR